jgi:RepB plasmid partitioning protein/ParB-like nuclease domain
MPKRDSSSPVKMAFEPAGLRVPMANILPLRQISTAAKKTLKFRQIAASVREVGVVEPLLVSRPRVQGGKFLLLDGHLRFEVLKEIGEPDANCLISTDDEAFTYNKHVNRIAAIQENKMILRAIERGIPRERIAKALNLDVKTLSEKMSMLAGICSEAAEILKDKHIPVKAFRSLRKMVPLRQIEAAELMVAMNKYTGTYVKSLLAATPQTQLIEDKKPKAIKGLSAEQIALMEQESTKLDREFKNIEEAYATDHLDLVLAKGYLAKLLANSKVMRYLDQYQREILVEFQKITKVETISA